MALTVQRPCGACDHVDDGPRNTIDVGDGRCVYFHLPGSQDCGATDADPRPDLDEDANTSQFREGLRALGVDVPDSRSLEVASVDCADPANHNTVVQEA